MNEVYQGIAGLEVEIRDGQVCVDLSRPDTVNVMTLRLDPGIARDLGFALVLAAEQLDP